jgi:inhibitor of KinA
VDRKKSRQNIQFIPSGDAALILKAGDDISPGTNAVVRKLLFVIGQEKIDGLIDLLPSYNELMVCYDPLRLDLQEITRRLEILAEDMVHVELPRSNKVTIPVAYGGEYGPDLEEVATRSGLGPDEVIRIHSSADYLVYMLGFMPGFCYLGGMDERIATPRKESPRLKIPAGAVGIAGSQTGIYPLESPGGWQLIGQTPLKLFDPGRKHPFLVNQGDVLRFEPVSHENYLEIAAAVRSGSTSG